MLYINGFLQVSSNGFFTFDNEVTYTAPQLLSASFPLAYLVAPFWANNDFNNRVGAVSYEVHTSEISSSYIDLVSTFISNQLQIKFNGSWMLVAEWSNVPQLSGSLTVVSTIK